MPRWMILKILSLVTAELNIGLLVGVVGYLAGARLRAPRSVLASDRPAL